MVKKYEEPKKPRILKHPYRDYEFLMTDKDVESYRKNNPWAVLVDKKK